MCACAAPLRCENRVGWSGSPHSPHRAHAPKRAGTTVQPGSLMPDSAFAAKQRVASLPRPASYWLAKKAEERRTAGKFFPAVVLPQPTIRGGKAVAGRRV